MYQTLIGVDPTDLTVLVPRLAESWEANAESTEFTFTLNPDAVFSDGSPVTAADVKFSWERLAGLEGSASYLMSGVTSIEAPDDQTVVVTMEAPNSAFINIVSAPYMGIVNQEAAEANGATADDTDSAEQWFLANSAGSGPFMLDSYTEGDELVLARNDAFWGEPSPFPGVTLKQVKDATAQLQQLQQGDVDIAMQINFDSVGELEGVEGITTELVDSYNFVYVAASAGSVGGEATGRPAGAGSDQVGPRLRGDPRHHRRRERQAAGVADPERVRGQRRTAAAGAGRRRRRGAARRGRGSTASRSRAAYPTVNVYGVDFDTMMAKVQQDLSAVGIDLELEPVEFAAVGRADHRRRDPVHRRLLRPRPHRLQPVRAVLRHDRGHVVAGLGRASSRTPTEQQLFADALAASGDEKTDLYNQLGQAMIDDLVIFPLVNPRPRAGLRQRHHRRALQRLLQPGVGWARHRLSPPRPIGRPGRDDELRPAPAGDHAAAAARHRHDRVRRRRGSSRPTRVASIVGERNMNNEAVVAAAKKRWGLDGGIIEQYFTYVSNLVTGDMGTSFRTKQSVTSDLWERLPGHRRAGASVR